MLSIAAAALPFAPRSRRRKRSRSSGRQTIWSRRDWSNSISRPGHNTTGISILATELNGKRQDILIEALPGLRRMAALADSEYDNGRSASSTTRDRKGTRRRAFDLSSCRRRGNRNSHRHGARIRHDGAQRSGVTDAVR